MQISEVSNRGLIAAGALLFVMQLHGYLHTANPDEFGFPEDNHAHEHERMQTEIQTPAPGSEYGISPESPAGTLN